MKKKRAYESALWVPGSRSTRNDVHVYFLSQVVVGWYSTEGGYESADILIQEFFDSETLDAPCIHLVVDTALQNAQMAIRAYTAQALVIGEGSVATHFIEVPIEYRNMDIERVGMDLLNRSVVDDIPTDAESFGNAIQKFSEVIERVRETRLLTVLSKKKRQRIKNPAAPSSWVKFFRRCLRMLTMSSLVRPFQIQRWGGSSRRLLLPYQDWNRKSWKDSSMIICRMFSLSRI